MASCSVPSVASSSRPRCFTASCASQSSAFSRRHCFQRDSHHVSTYDAVLEVDVVRMHSRLELLHVDFEVFFGLLDLVRPLGLGWEVVRRTDLPLEGQPYLHKPQGEEQKPLTTRDGGPPGGAIVSLYLAR